MYSLTYSKEPKQLKEKSERTMYEEKLKMGISNDRKQ